ncbi:MAG: 4-hydroxy-tetrahydrodipicolinate synthase [Bacteroidetes bacterium]|jgi:4-hydroxy-tetrahydrodipicolinate synthase|nr:4-hydroxy-tetrahydrodipicolinate synthase [Bacteroidota bacterium]
MKSLKGTGVALVTPFLKNGKIDFDALEKIVNHVIKGGVDYLVVMGTTGESVVLSAEEKKEVLDFIIKINKNRVPLVYGVGGNNTTEVIKYLHALPANGVDAILSVSPYYNKPNQSGIIQHFKAIAKESPCPVILYNVPGRTGSNMTAETTLQLAQEKNIAGIKEASGNMEQIMQIIHHRPKDFMVISGDDGITLPLIACGADGVISVIANAWPAPFSKMVRLALENKIPEARKLHYQLSDIIPLLFAEGSPSGIKYIMSEKKLCLNQFRLPVYPISKSLQEKIKKAAQGLL